MYNHDQIDEKQLLLKLRSGDTNAFERLYYSYSGMLFNNVLRMVKSVEVAEEILQELFQRIWERRAQIDVDKSFKSFLFTIAKHLVYDFFYRQTKQRQLEAHLIAVSTELYQHVDDAMSYKELETTLTRAIDQLPPQRKLVYTLCKIEGRSYEDVSHLLNISVSTISDHIVKATKFLKARCLAEQSIVFFLLFGVTHLLFS